MGFSVTAQADLRSDADAAYAQRENNPAKIAEARAKYQQLAQTTRGDDLVYVVSQLGRLAYYEGEMLTPKDNKDVRREIFSACWCASPNVVMGCREDGFIEKISPANLGRKHPAYYYFKGLCTGYWGEASSLADRARFVGVLKDMLREGPAADVDQRFDGGAIDRLAAGIHSNPEANSVGLFDPATAIAEAQRALQRENFPGDPNAGADYYDNWRSLAVALERADNKPEAVEVLRDAISQIEERTAQGRLPATREPETRWLLQQMKDQLARLGG